MIAVTLLRYNDGNVMRPKPGDLFPGAISLRAWAIGIGPRDGPGGHPVLFP